MSLASTSTIKSQLVSALGSKADSYFEVFQKFVAGRISRGEFDDSIRHFLDAPSLVQLHNSLIISLFDFSSHRRPPTPPPDAHTKSKAPPRKRRRTLPYQGPEDTDDGTLRSTRLKRWTVSLGKRERERIKGVTGVERGRPRADVDEIARERGLVLLSERGEPPGSRLPLHLASLSRTLTLQNVSDRLTLISAQKDLNPPPRSASSLLLLAAQAHLKHIVTQAITLSSSSRSISSVQPTRSKRGGGGGGTAHLTLSTFAALLTLSPSLLPTDSAAARRLMALREDEKEPEEEMGEDVALLRDREVRDQRWQVVALLGERSTVREALKGIR